MCYTVTLQPEGILELYGPVIMYPDRDDGLLRQKAATSSSSQKMVLHVGRWM